MLGGIFDLDANWPSMMGVSACAYLTAAAAVACANLLNPEDFRKGLFIAGLVSATSVIVCAGINTELTRLSEIAAALAGLTIATLIGLAARRIQAIGLALCTFLLYAGIGAGKELYVGTGVKIPTLGYILLFLMLMCWLFSALTFLADRYRIPVLFCVGAVAWASSSLTPWNDHVFRTADLKTPPVLPKPFDLLKRRSHPVLIATAGGGIQAAAWTTHVLSRLDQLTQNEFRKHVAVISSVSGGSVGALYFGAYFDNPQRAAEMAKLSSLDEIAWGWINPDIRRVFFPVPFFFDQAVDRGWALERSWEQRIPEKDTMLSDWAVRAAREDFPAFIFNATGIESGRIVTFSTSDFPSGEERDRNILLSKQPRDLRVSTAARLSASFPYVAPAARADRGGQEHFVDGGYADNYGVLSLIEWLQQAVAQGGASSMEDTFIILIRPSADANHRAASSEGWPYQLIAPLNGFLSARETGQLSVARRQLDIFLQKIGAKCHVVEIAYDPSQLPAGKSAADCGHQPLSWKLSRQQAACIDEVWTKGNYDVSKQVQQILAFVQATSPAASQ